MSMITRHDAAEKIFAYLNHSITLAELVAWSEGVMMDAEIAPADADAVAEVAARLGMADAENFGLLWEECGELLGRLGYGLNLEMRNVA